MDSGMILNFSTGDDLPARTQKLQGGSWRDRLKARRSTQRLGRGQPGSQRGAPSTSTQSELDRQSKDRSELASEAPPSKKRRPNPHDSAASQGQVLREGQSNERRSKPVSAPREVISSLFTYNPKPVTLLHEPEAENHGQPPPVPSNAPLDEATNTFTSLGLSPVLATHLVTKINLKHPTAIQKLAVSRMLNEENDVFIQSETGSGKTLAYLLPIVQRIIAMAESSSTPLQRHSGLFAIILAPTRELSKQILTVLDRVLGCANYIVAGTVIGGEKKKSEKARLRKGLNILVATPGRLADHLDHTKVLDVSKVRWLVLDEGDRLMELGFENDISKVVQVLDERKRKTAELGLPEKRTTILCSATLKMNVSKLGEISLKDAIHIKTEAENLGCLSANPKLESDSAFLAPAQLKQNYVVVPAKLRLVTLTALLKRTFSRKGSVMKAIIFVSCADSVEFHYSVFTRNQQEEPTSPHSPGDGVQPEKSAQVAVSNASSSPAPILSTSNNPVTLYKLHGSLPQTTRSAIVKDFANTKSTSILLATDVASRGLDLPSLDLVIEYDPAFSSDDHLHRIGRTARLGRDGRATVFLLPGKEEGYVEVLNKSFKKLPDALESASNITHMQAEEVLQRGFPPPNGVLTQRAGNGNWESRATEFQLELERWVLSQPSIKDLAKRAYKSHIRAYATHVAAERKWFDIKNLHLGHVAKSFGLRDAPGQVNLSGQGRGSRGSSSKVGSANKTDSNPHGERDVPGDTSEAARKMRDKIRKIQGAKLAGADEFNIA